MRFLTKLFLASLVFLFLQPVTACFADEKSDYEYQYGQYRQNYIEYKILKNDYLSNPTLDNQQKVILSAKQTISSRDLAKANFAAYLLSAIKSSNVNFTPIKPLLDSLESANKFYLSEAQNSQTIVTPNDLKTFSENYIANSLTHDRAFRTGVIAKKIAELVRFQVESKNALDITLPKLATPFSKPLQARVDELQATGNKINNDINDFANSLFSEEEVQNIDSDDYFSNKSDTVKKIQSAQLKWIDGLIDIDLNYAHS